MAGGSQLGERQRQRQQCNKCFVFAVIRGRPPHRRCRRCVSLLLHPACTLQTRYLTAYSLPLMAALQYSVPRGHGTPGVDLLH